MTRLTVGVGPSGVPFLERPGDQREFLAFVQRAEHLGYASVCVGDHLDGRGGPFVSLAIAAAATERVRLAVHVLCAELRNAAVLAQEARTLQIVSDGRLELGLGAGWLLRDFATAGVHMEPFAARLARLAATVATVRAEFAGSAVPAPRIVLGGGGPRMLDTAAALADIVTINIPLRGAAGLAFNTVAAGTRAQVEARVARVRAAAEAAGRTPALHIYVHEVHIGPDWRTVAASRAASLGMDADEYAHSPHVLVGDMDQVISALEERRQVLGFAYVSIPGGAMTAFAPALPAFR